MRLATRVLLVAALPAMIGLPAACRPRTRGASTPATQPVGQVQAESGRLMRRQDAAATAAPAAPAAPASAGAPKGDLLRSGTGPATAPDLAGELVKLRTRWLKDLGPGHGSAVHPPFLVVVNGDDDLAEHYLSATVLPATTRIQRQFMRARPDKPMTILLFAGQKAYRDACGKVLHADSPPYYGFFRPWEGLLAMDIQTGGGTLVHELTHAMIAFDFPDIPDWFNEGLGSLYEQCAWEGERIVGLANWRLAGLQQAIKAKKLGSLEELTRTDFRRGDTGLNYAQARYLCLYMQEQGCLESFYRSFRDGAREDPTGLKFLRQAFQEGSRRSLADVDQDYRRWVLTLRFPP